MLPCNKTVYVYALSHDVNSVLVLYVGRFPRFISGNAVQTLRCDRDPVKLITVRGTAFEPAVSSGRADMTTIGQRDLSVLVLCHVFLLPLTVIALHSCTPDWAHTHTPSHHAVFLSLSLQYPRHCHFFLLPLTVIALHLYARLGTHTPLHTMLFSSYILLL